MARQDYGGTSDDMISVGRAIVEALASLNATVRTLSGLIPVQQGQTVIAQGNLSPGASVFDINNIPAGFSYLFLQLQGVRMDTAAREVLLLASDNNGVSYDAGANYSNLNLVAGASPNNPGSGSMMYPGVNTLTTDQLFANVLIFAYQTGERVYRANTNATGNTRQTHGHWFGGTGAALSALRIAINGSGNFTHGAYFLSGIA